MDNGYYIGLMSGTSLDGIDAAVVHIQDKKYKLCSALTYPWPHEITIKLKKLIEDNDSLTEMLDLDQMCAIHFANAAQACLKKADLSSDNIIAIGCHGQTIRHKPLTKHPYSLQIGNPSTIAEITNITTVAHFRSRDISAGGQGAPLAPAFHQAAFQSPKQQRVIINIGGIANITLLTPNTETIGYDTGPGNRLLDDWIHQVSKKKFDQNGLYAASGKTNPLLLKSLLKDPYFQIPPPKSTGTDYFNLNWLNQHLKTFQKEKPENIQSTLTDLTAITIADQIKKQISDENAEVYICGGGIHNQTLMKALERELPHTTIDSTEALGVSPDWVEAIAFAWLAQQTIRQKPGNLARVTGAKGPRICGGLYYK